METTIMLVDDSEICNLMMKKVLSLQPMNLNIVAFTEPVLAFSQLKMLNPAVVFLDLNMPELDGWQFLELMQASGYTNRVIILTSSTSQLDRLRCAKFQNVLAYHTKPLSRELVTTLMASLQLELS